jgi:hypothetical protein
MRYIDELLLCYLLIIIHMISIYSQLIDNSLTSVAPTCSGVAHSRSATVAPLSCYPLGYIPFVFDNLLSFTIIDDFGTLLFSHPPHSPFNLLN